MSPDPLPILSTVFQDARTSIISDQATSASQWIVTRAELEALGEDLRGEESFLPTYLARHRAEIEERTEEERVKEPWEHLLDYVDQHEGAGRAGVSEEDLISEPGGVALLVAGFKSGDLRWAKKPEVTERDKRGRVVSMDGGNIRTAYAWERFSRDTYVPPTER